MNLDKLKKTIFSNKNEKTFNDSPEKINDSSEGINPINEATESNSTETLPVLTQETIEHFLSLPNPPQNQLTKNATEIDRYRYLPKIFYWNRERLQGFSFNKLNILLGTMVLGLVGITGNSIHNENTLNTKLKQANTKLQQVNNTLANSNKINGQFIQLTKNQDQTIQTYKSNINKDQSLVTTVEQNNISLNSNLTQTKTQLTQAQAQQQALIAQNQTNLKNAEFQKVSLVTQIKYSSAVTVTESNGTFYAKPTTGTYFGKCPLTYTIINPNSQNLALSYNKSLNPNVPNQTIPSVSDIPNNSSRIGLSKELCG